MVHHQGVGKQFTFETSLYIRPVDATHMLKCGYRNFLGLSQESIKSKVKAIVVPVVNTVLAPMGWQYIDVGVFGDYFEIYYKEASPAEPVTTTTVGGILFSIALIILGIAIISVAWCIVETGRMKAEAKADKKKLLEEGKITSEQYTELIESQAEEDMLGDIGELLKWGIIAIIVLAVAGAIGKVRGED